MNLLAPDTLGTEDATIGLKLTQTYPIPADATAVGGVHGTVQEMRALI